MSARAVVIVVISLLGISESVAADAVIPTTERSELMSLYSSTNGNTWTNNSNWCAGTCPRAGAPVFNAPGTECAWFGVKCDSTGTHVLGIDLSKNHLTGRIPKLTGFTNLQYFDGSANQLTGEIPDLTPLISLQVFNVSSNRLTGEIPDVAGLPKLQAFVVHDNHLKVEFPAFADIVKGHISEDAAAASETPEEQQKRAEKGGVLVAALAATGNDYPMPAVFVKRWNLLAQSMPEAQVATFTSRGHENDPRPIADLDGFNFNSAESTYLRLGISSVSIEYVSRRGNSMSANEQPNSYSITIKGHHTKAFMQFCIWAIQSTRGSFTVRSAIDLLGDAVRYVPPSDATDRQHHAEAEGIRLTLRKTAENSTCEVRRADQ